MKFSDSHGQGSIFGFPPPFSCVKAKPIIWLIQFHRCLQQRVQQEKMLEQAQPPGIRCKIMKFGVCLYFIAVHSFCLGKLSGAQPRPGVIPEDFEGPLPSGLTSGSFHCTWCCGGLLLGGCINLLNPVVENNGIAARLGGASKKINESFKAEDSGGNQQGQN